MNGYTVGANVEVADLQQGVTFVTGNDTGMTIQGTNGTAATIKGGSADGSDAVAFDAGVAHDQLWFAQSNNDLVVSVIGEDQTITVAGWYTSTNNRFAQIDAGDSFVATAAAVDQLVQAMAALSPPPLGQTTLPSGLAAELAPTLAANWQHS